MVGFKLKFWKFDLFEGKRDFGYYLTLEVSGVNVRVFCGSNSGAVYSVGYYDFGRSSFYLVVAEGGRSSLQYSYQVRKF